MILLLLLLSVTTGQEVESVKEEGMKEEGVKEEGVRARVLAQLVELGMAPGDISSLEEVSRVARESACPGVMEDLVTYSLHLEDGLVPAAILLQQVVRRQEVVRSSMEGAPWVVGERRITPSLACLAWDSQELVEEVRAALVPPSSLPYNFSLPLEFLPITSLEGEVGQPREVDTLLYGGNLKGGFFLEAGSHDSETNSDSLYWEVNHGWSGLLVEPHPLSHALGLSKHRRASSLQTCLSTTTKVATLHFDPSGAVRNASHSSMAGIVAGPAMGAEGCSETVELQCLPLYTILLALGNPTVHHFSLDIEGAELPVLRTVPWSLVDILAVSVETHLAGQVFPGDRAAIIAYMEEVGYRHLPAAHKGTGPPGTAAIRQQFAASDDLFVRRDVPLVGEGRPLVGEGRPDKVEL